MTSQAMDPNTLPLYSSLRKISKGLKTIPPSVPLLTNLASPSTLTRTLLVILFALTTILTVVATSSYATSIWLLQKQQPQQPAAADCSCGGIDIAEARRRGCRFSALAIAWLPPACFDAELSDEFDRAGPGEGGRWGYWRDINGTIRMTTEEVGLMADEDHGTGLFYTTQGWHVTHCMYTWRKELRSRWTGKTVEARSTGIKHIEHCEMIIKMDVPLHAITTLAGVSLNANEIGN